MKTILLALILIVLGAGVFYYISSEEQKRSAEMKQIEADNAASSEASKNALRILSQKATRYQAP